MDLVGALDDDDALRVHSAMLRGRGQPRVVAGGTLVATRCPIGCPLGRATNGSRHGKRAFAGSPGWARQDSNLGPTDYEWAGKRPAAVRLAQLHANQSSEAGLDLPSWGQISGQISGPPDQAHLTCTRMTGDQPDALPPFFFRIRARKR
jgi:hypothetical protein